MKWNGVDEVEWAMNEMNGMNEQTGAKLK